MDVLSFLVGLSLGLGLYFYRDRQNRHQLAQLLESLSRGRVENTDLPLLSRLRLEVQHADERQMQLEETIAVWQQGSEAAPLGYLQVDAENQLVWCNRGARELLKIDRWKPQQLRLLLELVRSYELDRAIEQTRRSQKSQVQEWVFQSTPRSPAGSKAYSVAIRAQTLPLKAGQVGVFLENRQPLLELKQKFDRAFSDLAHELRTPLTAIHLVAETLQTRLQGVERTWVEKMLRESDRAIDLIQTCLDVERLEGESDLQLNYESVLLEPFVIEVWQTVELLAAARSLTLNYTGQEALCLHGDRARLTQVFLNLFENSINHSPPQTTIQVAASQTRPVPTEQTSQKAWIIIDVIDSGCGFSEADLPHVFERLYRGDLSRARGASSPASESLSPLSGNGLGLSIVREIVRAHGGAIAAQNHPQTGGAWLQIKLPDII